MRISDILATKGADVATVRGEATVADAVAQMARRSIGALVVSDDGSTVDGVISERDVVRLMATDPSGLLAAKVRHLMSSPVHTCAPTDDVESVMATMTNRRVRHVPVLLDGRLCGLVSIGDVVKSRIEELQKDRKLLEDYITAR